MAVDFNATFRENNRFGASFTESDGFNADFSAVVVASDLPTYGGAYEVTPSAHESQTLETAGHIMENDVTVKIIPFFQTSNVSGDTVYIASEV